MGIDRDLLADDAIDAVEAAQKAGVEVRLYVERGRLRVELHRPGGSMGTATIGVRGRPIMPGGIAHVWQVLFAHDGPEREDGWG